MTAYGSASRPVSLDPLARIVEVGWGARYIAFMTKVTQEATGQTSIVCSPVTQNDFPQNPTNNAYHESVTLKYLDDQEVRSVFRRKNRAWESIGVGGMQFLHLPTAPFGTFNFAAWHTLIQGVASDPDTGPEMKVPLPNKTPEELFASGTTSSVGAAGSRFIGSTACVGGIGAPSGITWKRLDAAFWQQMLPETKVTLNFASVRITDADDKIWNPVGIKTIPVPDQAEIEIWVLCQKAPA